MKKVIIIAYVVLSGFASNGWALDLGDAKTQGLIGETPSGYLEAVVSPSSSVSALINDINEKRKRHYQQIATKNGTPLEVVEKLAGETALKKTESGNYVKIGGKWIKR